MYMEESKSHELDVKSTLIKSHKTFQLEQDFNKPTMQCLLAPNAARHGLVRARLPPLHYFKTDQLKIRVVHFVARSVTTMGEHIHGLLKRSTYNETRTQLSIYGSQIVLKNGDTYVLQENNHRRSSPIILPTHVDTLRPFKFHHVQP